MRQTAGLRPREWEGKGGAIEIITTITSSEIEMETRSVDFMQEPAEKPLKIQASHVLISLGSVLRVFWLQSSLYQMFTAGFSHLLATLAYCTQVHRHIHCTTQSVFRGGKFVLSNVVCNRSDGIRIHQRTFESTSQMNCSY